MSLAGTLEREPGGEFRRGMLSAPDLEVFVPSEHSEASTLARWKLNGTLKISARDNVKA